MKTRTDRYAFADLPKNYRGLVAILPPRTIHDAVDLANTMELIDALAGHALTDDQDDYLETLAELVNAYDEASNPLAADDSTPRDVLEFLLEQHAMNASDLGTLLGDRALGSKILRGQREISKAHARILAARFKVNPGVFI